VTEKSKTIRENNKSLGIAIIENSNNNKLEIHECLDHIISAKNMVIRGHPINIQLAWEDLMMKWLKSKPTIH